MSKAPTTKQERKRAAYQARQAARRRDRQRRVLRMALVGLGAVAVIAVVVVVLLSGGGNGGGPGVLPSKAGTIQAGPARTGMFARGDTVPAFSAPGFRMAPDADGNLSVDRQRIEWAPGTPTVLSIWAPWCPHCQVELPKLARVMEDYPSVDLVTVVTSFDAKTDPTPDGYLADHGLTFPVAVDDADGTLATMFGIDAFPTVYFVNADGTVAQAATGEIAESTLRSTIDSLS
ncbi:MAG: TlpA family protein disulfide reductase [Candidatus Velamenicoccus archaeovorus]